MLKEQTAEEKIEIATEDVKKCLLENVLASRAEVEARDRKKKAHYALQKANERLNSLRVELMDITL
jgi:hypothetical protein